MNEVPSEAGGEMERAETSTTIRGVGKGGGGSWGLDDALFFGANFIHFLFKVHVREEINAKRTFSKIPI